MSDEERAARIVERHRLEEQRMRLLAQEYGIEAGAGQWYRLALALAKEFVPGLQEEIKKGRPKKWDDYALGILAVEVERHTKVGKTDAAAAKVLAKQEPWKSLIERWGEGKAALGADPAGAILKAYKEAKKSRFAKVARDAYAWDELQGAVSEWDASVSELAKKPVQTRK